MKLFLTLTTVLYLTEARKGGGSKGSSSSKGSSWSSGSSNSFSSNKGSSSSWFSKPKLPTSSSGMSYKYKPVTDAMKSKSWTSKVVKAAGAYYAIKKAKKFRGKMWSGYGYDGDDYYRDNDDIEVCYSCRSVNGSDLNCERQDASIAVSLMNMEVCVGEDYYCGLAITELEGSTYFERGCYPVFNVWNPNCPNILPHPNDVTNYWTNSGALATKINQALENTYCDYCDTNGCNGWTLRGLPDDAFASYLPVVINATLLLFLAFL